MKFIDRTSVVLAIVIGLATIPFMVTPKPTSSQLSYCPTPVGFFIPCRDVDLITNPEWRA